MKAIKIQPNTQSIEMIEVNSVDDIKDQIGFDTVISDDLTINQEQLYFDEDCFLRGTKGRFQIDKLIPVSGIGIIVGTSNDDSSISEVTTSLEDMRERIKFLPES
jgi:hypothetical protein